MCSCTLQNLFQPLDIDHWWCLDLWLGSLSIPCQPHSAKRSWQLWQSLGTRPSKHRSVYCYSSQFCHPRCVKRSILGIHTHSLLGLVHAHVRDLVRELWVKSICLGGSLSNLFQAPKRHSHSWYRALELYKSNCRYYSWPSTAPVVNLRVLPVWW